MSDWTYQATWRVKRATKTKTFTNKDNFLLFVMKLRKHGIQPICYRRRDVTWVDRIKAMLGMGQIA